MYATIKAMSIHCAAEYLNMYLCRKIERRFCRQLKLFADGIRKRRLVPHQTDVDNFFSMLSEDEVQYIFGNVLMELNRRIKNSKIGGAKLHFIVDNTKFPYYGPDRTSHEVGSNGLKGTRYCRMFQAFLLNGCGMSLYTEFQPIEKGVYRGKCIGPALDWVQWNGFKISNSLIDREFYRVAIIRCFRRRKVGVVLPAKKFQQVETEFRKYLFNMRPISDNYIFSQSMHQYPNQMSVNVQLSLVGHEDLTAQEIKNDLWAGKINLLEAMKKMAGFFTTIVPWKNANAFCSWLKRVYKIRWNIETAFRIVNLVHESFRNHSWKNQLAQLYIRGYIYNYWQVTKKEAQSQKLSAALRSLREFLRNFSYVFAREFTRYRFDHVISQIKNKMEVYFN
jgi:hypothetical protein